MSTKATLTVNEAEERLDDLAVDLDYIETLAGLINYIAGEHLFSDQARYRTTAAQQVLALSRALEMLADNSGSIVTALRKGMDNGRFKQKGDF